MTSGLLGLATVVVAVLLLRLPLRWAFALFLTTLLLVPDTMRLPFGGGQLLLLRVLPAVFLVGLVFRVRSGEIDRDAFRPTAATGGLVLFGVVAWLVGVIGADVEVPPTFSRDAWLVIVDQMIVLVAVVAAVRSIGSVRAAASLATAVTITAVIAIVERVTGSGYAELAFRHLPDQRAGSAGAALETRSGMVRPRVASRFSLAYAWQATLLLPVVVATAALASKRLVRAAAVPLVAGAIALTSTRSAYLGVAVTLAVFALLCGRRSIQLGVLAFALVGFGLALGTGALGSAFNAPEAAGSNAIREERAPVVLDVVSDDPFTGLGYGALLDLGLPSTDSSWIQLYAELGAFGVAALAMSVAMALAAIGPALTRATRRSPERVVAAACWAGVAVSLLGAAYFDLFTGRQSVLPLWALAGIGVVAAEEARAVEAVPPRVFGYRLALPALGVLAGLAVVVLAPRPASVVADIQLVPIATDAVAGEPDSFVGRTLAHTVCSLATETATRAGADASCLLPYGRGSGAARLRLTGADPRVVEDALREVVDSVGSRVESLDVLSAEVERTSTPSPVRTAPIAGAAIGAAAALLLPVRNRRRPSPGLVPALP